MLFGGIFPQRCWHLVGMVMSSKCNIPKIPSKYKISTKIIDNKFAVISHMKVFLQAWKPLPTEKCALILGRNSIPCHIALYELESVVLSL